MSTSAVRRDSFSAMMKAVLIAIVVTPTPPRAPSIADDAALRRHAVARLLEPHEDLAERVGVDRLHQVVARAGPHDPAEVVHVVDGAEHHHRRAEARELGQPGLDLLDRHALDVDDHEAGRGGDPEQPQRGREPALADVRGRPAALDRHRLGRRLARIVGQVGGEGLALVVRVVEDHAALGGCRLGHLSPPFVDSERHGLTLPSR